MEQKNKNITDKIFRPNLSIKISLFTITTVIFLSASIIITGNYFLKKQKQISTKNELIAITTEFNNTIASYNAMLKFINKQIAPNLLDFQNKNKATAFLKELYVNLEPEEGNIIFTDIIWYNSTQKFAVNKNSTTTTSDLEKYLSNKKIQKNKNHTNPYLVTFNHQPGNHELYLFYDILDKNQLEEGKIIIQINFSRWLDYLKTRLDSRGYTLFLINQNNEIILSTNPDAKLKNKTPKNDSNDLEYIIFESLELNLQEYYLAMGYSKNTYTQKLITKTLPSLIILWSCTCIFLFILYAYRRNLKKEIHSLVREDMNELAQQNRIYMQSQITLSSETSHQIQEANEKIDYYKGLLEAYDHSTSERKELETEIFNNTGSTLTNIRESIWILTQAPKDKKDTTHHLDKQTLVLNKLHETLTNILYSCPSKNNSNLIDFRKIISDTLLIYSKEILLLKLTVNIDVPHASGFISIDELVFRQILANLFRETVSFSRPHGTINIKTDLRERNGKKEFILTIQDDGFGITYEHNEAINEYCALFPLEIEIEKIAQFIRSFQGELTSNYIVDNGKIITLTLPLKK